MGSVLAKSYFTGSRYASAWVLADEESFFLVGKELRHFVLLKV